MSKSKKPLLKEATVRRFMKLANLEPIGIMTEKFKVVEEEEEEDVEEALLPKGAPGGLQSKGGNNQLGSKRHADHKLKKAGGDAGLASKGSVTEELGDEPEGLEGLGGEPEGLEGLEGEEGGLEGGDENEDLLRRVVQAVADELGVEVEVDGGEEGLEGEEEEEGLEGLEGEELGGEEEGLPPAGADDMYEKLESAGIELQEDLPDDVVSEVTRRVAARLLNKA